MAETVEYKGKQYTLHKQSSASGDMVFVAEDDMAIKVQSYALKAHSPVFANMLLTLEPASPPVICIPDISSAALAVVVQAFENRTSNIDWTTGSEAISFCIKYECDTAGRAILADCALRALGNQIFDSLVLASSLNAVLIGSCILLRGYDAYTDPKLRRYSGFVHTYKGFLVLEASFCQGDAMKFRPDWIHALSLAETKAKAATEGEPSLHQPAFWGLMANHFLKHLGRTI